jgi:hydrogenase small subunit
MTRPSVVWIQLQECTGCVESVLRTADPTIGNLILDLVSLDYSHTLMAASGEASERALHDAMKGNAGKYLLMVTGSVPLADDGIYTTIAGRTAKVILEEAAAGAAAVIAIGACAHWGSIQAARPNPTGAVGVSTIVHDKPVVNIAGCPPIGDVVTATIVHYLTFGRLPALDGEGRPLFAYGARIHDQCPRRANYDAGQYVEEFDDEAARKGWCLYHVGCKGPATFSPCPIFQWNSGTSWPIGAGHPCIGCTEPKFWDTMTPFYERLPGVSGFGVERNLDMFGAALAAGAAAGVAAHAVATGVHQARARRALPVVEPPPSSGAPGSGS